MLLYTPPRALSTGFLKKVGKPGLFSPKKAGGRKTARRRAAFLLAFRDTKKAGAF